MGADPFTIGIAAISVISAENQRKERSSARRAAKRAESAEQRRRDLQTARERIKLVRKARLQRATAINRAQSGEGTGGSGLTATQANISGQLASGIGFLDENQRISSQVSNLRTSAASSLSKADDLAAVTGGVQDVLGLFAED